METSETTPCPACGGAGGGPFGRAGSAWDDDAYVCPRCQGSGMVMIVADASGERVERPGIAKATPRVPAKKRAVGSDPR